MNWSTVTLRCTECGNEGRFVVYLGWSDGHMTFFNEESQQRAHCCDKRMELAREDRP